MNVDEFARRTHTSVRNVRAYLERGLLPAARIVDRRSAFDQRHVDRMGAIQRLQGDGFSLQGIAALFHAWEDGVTLEELVGTGPSGGGEPTGPTDASALFPATKFVPPSTRREHLVRRRCLEGLAAAAPRHLLVTAPAGSGKSILAGQVLAAHDGPGAWVSLGPAERDAGRFWTALLVVLRTVVPDVDDLLTGLAGGGPVDRCVVDLVDRLHTARAGVVVVLDDLHEADDPAVMRQLDWFVDRVHAEDCRLVLASRTLPSLAVGRLTVRGQLARLGAAELALDADEVRALLTSLAGAEVDAARSETVRERTDGWASGVYLAGLGLRSRTPWGQDAGRLHDGAPGSEPDVDEEILRAFAPGQLELLEAVSDLERFTPELCDAVRGRGDSRELLEAIHRESLFVVPLDEDRTWWRLHQALGAALGRHGSDAARRPRLLRAGRWHEGRGETLEAIDLYLRADEPDVAAGLVGRSYPHVLNISHRGAVVGDWLAALPAGLVERTPSLGVAATWLAGLRGDATEMGRDLERLRAFPGDLVLADGGTVDFDVHVLRAVFHFGSLVEAFGAARTALSLCPADAQWRPMLEAAWSLLAYWVEGPTDDALRTAESAAGAETRPLPIASAGAHALCALILAERGAVEEAHRHLARSAELRDANGLGRMPQAANTWASSARARLVLGDVDGAAEDATAGLASVGDVEPDRDATGAVAPILIALGHARGAQGRHEEAASLLQRAGRYLAHHREPGRLPLALAAAEAARRGPGS